MGPESKTAGGVNPSPAAHSDGIFFYRCLTCSRCMIAVSARAYLRKHGRYCPCGGIKASPSWPVGLEWLRPDVAFYSIRCKVNDWLGRD